jgi:hypothetical protein
MKITRRRSLPPLLALAAVLLLGPAGATAATKGKRVKHELGFRAFVPDGWTAEPAEMGMTLSPPGAVIDPKREDNPEVYSLWSVEADKTTEEEYIKSLRERFKQSGVKLDREGDLETFSQPSHPGVIYTFDFTHPELKKPYRIRVFAFRHKGRPLLLVATGQRERLAARDGVLRDIARNSEWQ